MAEKKRWKQKRQQEDGEKPTKEEYAVAKFLRFSIPSKEGKLMGMEVQYFIASKAIDGLLESKWSISKSKDDALFDSRNSCITYCNMLLQKGIFHRAMRVEKMKDRDKKRKKMADADKAAKEDVPEKKVTKKEKKTKRGKDGAGVEEGEEPEREKKEMEKKDEKKDDEKKKRKMKLEMAEPQLFMDGDEVFVWIYDPMPLKSKLIGLLIVVGAVAVCLFPLWPPEVRLGVYYLSLAGAGFVGFILSLCIIQRILFLGMWAVTFGKHHFWLLPNLTEDVSFLDSFKPFYQHDVKHATQPSIVADKTPSATDTGEDEEEEGHSMDIGYEMVEVAEVEEDGRVENVETKKHNDHVLIYLSIVRYACHQLYRRR